MRTDPPVSDPIAAGASPKATEAAAPDDDPPGTASASFTQGGVAVTGFMAQARKRQFGHVGLAKTDQPHARGIAQHVGIAVRHAALQQG